MAGHRRALGVRIFTLLVGVVGLAVAALPARGQLPTPAIARLPSGLVAPASYAPAAYTSSASSADWLAADAATTVEASSGNWIGCSQPACCGPDYGWYVMLAGAAQSRDNVQEIGDPATFLIFDDGFAINMALGHQFDLFRLDFEYSYFNNQIETAGAGIPNVGNFVGDAVGNVSVKAYTLNTYYDYRIGQSCFKPYVGAGIGLMQSEINSLFPSFFPALGAATGGVNTTSNVKFCYQFRVGLSYELTHRTELFSGYRFFDAGPLTFAGEPFGVFSPDGATFHNFEAGLRVKF
jgi:opacity protein-like surface antigen